MNVTLLPPAHEDLAVARDFYEFQAEGPGSHFLNCLFTDIDTLEKTAGIHTQRFRFYLLVYKEYPYSFCYRLMRDEVVICRILDGRQEAEHIAASRGEAG